MPVVGAMIWPVQRTEKFFTPTGGIREPGSGWKGWIGLGPKEEETKNLEEEERDVTSRLEKLRDSILRERFEEADRLAGRVFVV